MAPGEACQLIVADPLPGFGQQSGWRRGNGRLAGSALRIHIQGVALNHGCRAAWIDDPEAIIIGIEAVIILNAGQNPELTSCSIILLDGGQPGLIDLVAGRLILVAEFLQHDRLADGIARFDMINHPLRAPFRRLVPMVRIEMTPWIE